MLKIPFRAARWTLTLQARLKHFWVDLNPPHIYSAARQTAATSAFSAASP
jgi:hypothetical protein